MSTTGSTGPPSRSTHPTEAESTDRADDTGRPASDRDRRTPCGDRQTRRRGTPHRGLPCPEPHTHHAGQNPPRPQPRLSPAAQRSQQVWVEATSPLSMNPSAREPARTPGAGLVRSCDSVFSNIRGPAGAAEMGGDDERLHRGTGRRSSTDVPRCARCGVSRTVKHT